MSDNDYLIQLHMTLPPYNRMPKDKAIEAIKQHIGLDRESHTKEKKFVFDFSADMMSECMRYANIRTISEEEDVMSGSEDHYVDKWIRREPYNTMPIAEAKALIMSKLTIVHRNAADVSNISEGCGDYAGSFDSEDC